MAWQRLKRTTVQCLHIHLSMRRARKDIGTMMATSDLSRVNPNGEARTDPLRLAVT
jgi:hypothetical protein